jgi:ubiquinone/menaquinone biosynthesis C-methylase UbiE
MDNEVPMNDDAGLARARYAAMRWNTPLSVEHADTLIERFGVNRATSVLDLGCGWGELLLRTVAAAGGDCTGTGVDTDDALLERARRAAVERRLEERVTFIKEPAEAWTEPADRVITIGASHAWGGTAQALMKLARIVSPGGRLLFGEGCWERQPTEAALAIFGDDVFPLPEVLGYAKRAGWRVLSVTTADQREWDEFESSHRRGQEEWLASNPDSPAALDTRTHLDARLSEYVEGYRGVLGFAYLILTR